MSIIWEEIHGFSTPEEYRRFCSYIEGQVALGAAREREFDPAYKKGELVGGRWFEEIETNEIWRLIPPDFPFRGVWERIDKTFLF
jgi:hypothetical protein